MIPPLSHSLLERGKGCSFLQQVRLIGLWAEEKKMGDCAAKRRKEEVESPGGGKGWYLLKYRSPEEVPRVSSLDVPSEARFRGSPADFAEKHCKDRPDVNVQLWNKVRVCPKCGKAVAFTLPSCNGCGFPEMLQKTEISKTENVMIAFCYGMEKTARFPLKLGLRYQDENFLCYNDILALSPCHLNCIPTTHHIPDWRYLLLAPQRSLDLIRKMWEISSRVVEEQFWANTAWRNFILRGAKDGSLAWEELKTCFLTGMNYPPSQYQLHLQFIVPPMMPFDFHKLENGDHFHHNRFFPFEYLEAVLTFCIKEGESLTFPWPTGPTEAEIEEIIKFFEVKGVSYEQIHGDMVARAKAAQRKLAKWEKGHFEALAKVDPSTGAERVVGLLPNGEEDMEEGGEYSLLLEGEDAGKVRAEDKKILMNCVATTYYKHAKAPGEVAHWP